MRLSYVVASTYRRRDRTVVFVHPCGHRRREALLPLRGPGSVPPPLDKLYLGFWSLKGGGLSTDCPTCRKARRAKP